MYWPGEQIYDRSDACISCLPVVISSSAVVIECNSCLLQKTASALNVLLPLIPCDEMVWYGVV